MSFWEHSSNTPEKIICFEFPYSLPLCSHYVAPRIFRRDHPYSNGQTHEHICRESKPLWDTLHWEVAECWWRRGFTALYGQSLNPILKYCLAVKVKTMALVVCTPHKRFTATRTAGRPLLRNQQGTGTQMGRQAPFLCLCEAALWSLMPILRVFCFASHPLIVFGWGVLFCFVFLWFEICIFKKQSGCKE